MLSLTNSLFLYSYISPLPQIYSPPTLLIISTYLRHGGTSFRTSANVCLGDGWVWVVTIDPVRTPITSVASVLSSVSAVVVPLL